MDETLPNVEERLTFFSLKFTLSFVPFGLFNLLIYCPTLSKYKSKYGTGAPCVFTNFGVFTLKITWANSGLWVGFSDGFFYF